MDTFDDPDPATDTPSDAPTDILPPNEFGGSIPIVSEDASDITDITDITDIIGDDDFLNATDGNATDVPSFETPAASINSIIDDISSSTSSYQNSFVTIATGLVGAVAVILLV